MARGEGEARLPLDPRAWGLYVITDRHQTGRRSLDAVIAEALAGGARAFQLREKDLPARDLCRLAEALLARIRAAGALLLINDRVDVTLGIGADGVHLTRRSLPPAVARALLRPGMLLGVSCHSLEEALEAAEGGADFVLLGPIFATPSKAAYGPPVGPGLIRQVRPAVACPILGVGGITAANAGEVLAAGADGVAVISAVMGAPDVVAATRALLTAVRRAGRPA
ncbi:MAG: thiamine phosphate synthase [candidate division NC10 bacterium]|nr:thiamine phosphate synthase [candidate division NC10 bacterium]